MVLNIRAIALVSFSVLVLLVCPATIAAKFSVVLQAEAMSNKTGGLINADGTAWGLRENGSISQPVFLTTKGRYRFEVLARGSYVHGAWPVMQLKVDGVAVGAPITVTSSEWSAYAVEAKLEAGTRNVSLDLTNAYFETESTEYRLLEVDQISIDELSRETANVPWKLTVVLLGPIDQVQQAEIPVKEAVSFIEARTRLVFDIEYVVSYAVLDYTPYRVGTDFDGDGVGDETAYLLMGWNMPLALIESLPVSSSYLFLYTMNGLRPLQAGSSLGVSHGISKGGKPRPYSSVPTDQWWYINEPHDGFSSWAAQILTHEIINTIQGKIEAAPYNCPQLTARWGLPAAEFESQRLLRLDERCYERLGKNDN